MIYDVINSTPLPRRKGPLTALECSIPWQPLRLGPGGVLKLHQRVLVAPGHQTYFSAFGGKKLSVWQ